MSAPRPPPHPPPEPSPYQNDASAAHPDDSQEQYPPRLFSRRTCPKIRINFVEAASCTRPKQVEGRSSITQSTRAPRAAFS